MATLVAAHAHGGNAPPPPATAPQRSGLDVVLSKILPQCVHLPRSTALSRLAGNHPPPPAHICMPPTSLALRCSWLFCVSVAPLAAYPGCVRHSARAHPLLHPDPGWALNPLWTYLICAHAERRPCMPLSSLSEREPGRHSRRGCTTTQLQRPHNGPRP